MILRMRSHPHRTQGLLPLSGRIAHPKAADSYASLLLSLLLRPPTKSVFSILGCQPLSSTAQPPSNAPERWPGAHCSCGQAEVRRLGEAIREGVVGEAVGHGMVCIVLN